MFCWIYASWVRHGPKPPESPLVEFTFVAVRPVLCLVHVLTGTLLLLGLYRPYFTRFAIFTIYTARNDTGTAVLSQDPIVDVNAAGDLIVSELNPQFMQDFW